MNQSLKHVATLRASTLAGLTVFFTATIVLAQQNPVVVPSTNRWQNTVAAGLTLTSGNSDTLLATASLDTKRKWGHHEAAFGISGGYGENTVNGSTAKNTEFVQGFGQYNRLLSDRFYGGLRLDGQYDGIAGVDYRFKASPLAGYYLVKTTRTKLSVEAGPSGVFEELKGVSEDSYLAMRFGERLEHKLTESTRLWESIDYVPQVDHWSEKYMITGEAGIETAINKRWSLRVLLQDMFNSLPAPGRKQNDVRLVAGTSWKF